jgi:uncharacterized protein YjbJ (UPF0337 family)
MRRQVAIELHYHTPRELIMNWDQIEGNWKQMNGLLAQRWGKLTEDDLAIANGKRDILEGRIQERYGIDKEAAEEAVTNFLSDQNAVRRTSPDVATEGGPLNSETIKIGM